MKEIIERLVRSLTGDNSIVIKYKLKTDQYGVWNTFDVAHAGKHIYTHNFTRGSFNPTKIAKAIVNTLKEEKIIP